MVLPIIEKIIKYFTSKDKSISNEEYFREYVQFGGNTIESIITSGLFIYREKIYEYIKYFTQILYNLCTENILISELQRINEYKTKFSFNLESGLIIYNGDNSYKDNKITTLLCNDTKTTHSIFMITNLITKEINFKVNNIILDNSINNISFIDNKPIHSALVMSYLCNNN
jgi:hypothetical protein